MTTETELLDQVGDLYMQIAKRDPAMALQVATGAFVSLLLSYMQARGYETDTDIRVDGGDETRYHRPCPEGLRQGISLEDR